MQHKFFIQNRLLATKLRHYSIFINSIERGKLTQLVSGALVLSWLFACAYGFWWFNLRHLTNFNQYYVNFDGTDLSKLRITASSTPARIIHFIDKSCPCSRFAETHITELKQKFALISEHYTWPNLPAAIKSKLRRQLPVPASPAVAIWDSEGQLAYFGPYSSGAFCGDGSDFVSATLKQLENSQNPNWVNHDVLGCYCLWQQTNSQTLATINSGKKVGEA